MYSKLFSSLWKGSLYGARNEQHVFVYLLGNCDAEGIVVVVPEAIAAATGIPIEEVKAALVELEAPDPRSRSTEEHGKRIKRLDPNREWGWLIVNYQKYRAQEINNRLIKTIREDGGWIDAVYMCPHQPQDLCDCRKPLPGFLFRAARELSIDLSSSWMVGDAWSDLLAGQSAGLHGVILVKTGRGSSQLLETQPGHVKPYYVFDDLFGAYKAITDFTKGM